MDEQSPYYAPIDQTNAPDPGADNLVVWPSTLVGPLLPGHGHQTWTVDPAKESFVAIQPPHYCPRPTPVALRAPQEQYYRTGYSSNLTPARWGTHVDQHLELLGPKPLDGMQTSEQAFSNNDERAAIAWQIGRAHSSAFISQQHFPSPDASFYNQSATVINPDLAILRSGASSTTCSVGSGETIPDPNIKDKQIHPRADPGFPAEHIDIGGPIDTPVEGNGRYHGGFLASQLQYFHIPTDTLASTATIVPNPTMVQTSSTTSPPQAESSGHDERVGAKLRKPRPRRIPSRNSRTGSSLSAPRQPFADQKLRNETSITRKNRACVRCRQQRIRCLLDPDNPSGPCLRCRQLTCSIFDIPCLRYKVTDTTLFRTGSTLPRFRRMSFHGQGAGTIRGVRSWIPGTRYLEVSQGYDAVLRLPIRQFSAKDFDATAINDAERPLYSRPYGIVDFEAATDEFVKYLQKSSLNYRQKIIFANQNDLLSRYVFTMAHTLAQRDQPSQTRPSRPSLLEMSLLVWTLTRFNEGNWRVVNDAGIGKLEPNEFGLTPMPGLVDWQFAVTVIAKLLLPARKQLLEKLQDMFSANNPCEFLRLFLAVYILLHSYELVLKHQRGFARRHKAPGRYTNMDLVRRIHEGAKILLVHYHYSCKGEKPFSNEWKLGNNKAFANLDPEQQHFIETLVDKIEGHRDSLLAASMTDDYDRDHWFTGQMFDPKWSPRDTPL